MERLPFFKDRCPGCRRRTLAVSWFDEKDEGNIEYLFFRCHSCAARYRQRPGGLLEDASDPKFDDMFIGESKPRRDAPLWDDQLDA